MRFFIPLFALITLLLPKDASAEDDIPPFARHVVTHVLMHELGHAVFREFNVPILSNEEALADGFATFFVTQYLRDSAPDIIVSRARSWIYEDSEVDPAAYDHKGEHQLDIRRAYQTLCLFYGADPAEFTGYVAFAEFSERDLADCSDTAPDQFAAWTAVLEDLPRRSAGTDDPVRVIYGEGPMKDAFIASGILEQVADLARDFDWPNGPITLHFDSCDGGASWSRSKKRILLCDSYVARFIAQGKAIAQGN